MTRVVAFITKTLAAVLVVCAFVLPLAATAQVYIVKGSGNANRNVENSFTNVGSFTPAVTTQVVGIKFDLFRVGSGSAGSIEIQVLQGTTVVASGSILRSDANQTDDLYTVDFTEPFTAVAGTTYDIEFRTTVNINPSVGVKFSNTADLEGDPVNPPGAADLTAGGLSYGFGRLPRYWKPLHATPFMACSGGGWIVSGWVY